MRYVIIYTTTDYQTHKVRVNAKEYDDFEEMMIEFTLLTSSHDNVLVIETKNKKAFIRGLLYYKDALPPEECWCGETARGCLSR